MENADSWIKEVNAFMPLVVFILSVLLGLIGWFGRTMVQKVLGEIKTTNEKVTQWADTITRQFAEERDRIERVEKDFLRFQAQLPRIYTLKDDHIRHITIVEKKIDDHANTTQGSLNNLMADVKILLREIPKRKNDG
jgi:hypothetical protein